MPSDSAPPPPAARLLGLTARIVSAHLERNPVTAAQLPELIRGVHRALGGLSQDGATTPAEPAKPVPAVPVRRSVAHDRITCLECGARMAMLKRHLATAHGLAPEAYRERWGLPRDYPMVAPDYAEVRSGLAKQAGLGRGRRGGQAGEEGEAEPIAPAAAEDAAPATHAAPDNAEADPAVLMDAESAAPEPTTRRSRKRGSLVFPEEASQSGPDVRADAPEDAAPAEEVGSNTPAPARGGRGGRRPARKPRKPG